MRIWTVENTVMISHSGLEEEGMRHLLGAVGSEVSQMEWINHEQMPIKSGDFGGRKRGR
jgi:hypothetical protein